MQTSFPSMNLPYALQREVSSVSLTTAPWTDADERNLDQVLADSFPASDPPPWTFGRVDRDHIGHAVTATASARADWSRNDQRGRSLHTTNVVVATRSRTGRQRLASGMGAIGVALLVPIGILAVGLPIAIAARVLLEVAGWLTASIFK